MHPFHTLETLPGAAAGPKPARLAVLGNPVSHSASPQLHQPALDALGIAASYVRLEVEPGDLPKAFALMAELGFIGCNVTVPHKFEAMGSCSEVSGQAQLLGAVNTVVFRDGGTIPTRFTCSGDEVSPPLRWSGVPADARVLEGR